MLRIKNYFLNSPQKLVSIKVTTINNSFIIFNVLQELQLQTEHANAYWGKNIPLLEPYKEHNPFLKTILQLSTAIARMEIVRFSVFYYYHYYYYYYWYQSIRSLWELEINIIFRFESLYASLNTIKHPTPPRLYLFLTSTFLS